MKHVCSVACLLFAASTTTAMAQTNGQDNSLPESMRIEQSVTQQNESQSPSSAGATTRRGSSTASDAPGGAGTGVEMNRLDPAAPSPQRLQIDDGTSAAVRQNPEVDTLHPGAAGTSYNSILRGAPSTNGVSTGASSGTSGLGGRSSGASGGLGGAPSASSGGALGGGK